MLSYVATSPAGVSSDRPLASREVIPVGRRGGCSTEDEDAAELITRRRCRISTHSCRGPEASPSEFEEATLDEDGATPRSLSLSMDRVTLAGRVSLLTKTMTTPPLCCRLQKLYALTFVVAGYGAG